MIKEKNNNTLSVCKLDLEKWNELITIQYVLAFGASFEPKAYIYCQVLNIEPCDLKGFIFFLKKELLMQMGQVSYGIPT